MTTRTSTVIKIDSPHHWRKALEVIASKDKKMAALIEKVGRLRPDVDRDASPFHALSRSIVFQQLAGSAARAIHGRVMALFPKTEHLDPGEIIKIPEKTLREAGLSNSKMLALKDLAHKTVEGIVPSSLDQMASMSDEEIVERLTQVRGIGPWTAEMLLMFYLGRPDVLPVTDYGVRKGFATTYKKKELPTPLELMKFGERWRPYRSAAAWYLWRSLELPQKRKEKK